MEELTRTEESYRATLSKLAYSQPSQPQHIRRLVAHHQSFLRVTELVALTQWLDSGVRYYEQYIENYAIDAETLDTEVTLRKAPLVRINQLHKLCQRLGIHVQSVGGKYQQLAIRAKDKVEEVNLALDLNTICFNEVKDLHTFGKTVAFFSLEDVIKRDYFHLSLSHPLCHYDGLLIEVFLLSNNLVAITKVLSVGRSLMFPLLNVGDFKLQQNDSEAVVLSRGNIDIKFKCPDDEQMYEWNHLLDNLPVSSSFELRHSKLDSLKGAHLGLGLQLDPHSQLRRSSPMLSKHDSLLRTSVMSESSLKLDLDQYFTQDADLSKLNDHTNGALSPLKHLNTPHLKNQISPNMQVHQHNDSMSSLTPERTNLKKSSVCNNLNDSVVSLPMQAHAIRPTSRAFASTTDIPQVKNKEKKLKKRKSIFNIFAKKTDDEPSFEIVTKPVVITREVESMASLQRSIQQLNLSVNGPREQEPQLPSPFVSKPSTASTTTKLSELEQSIINESHLVSTLTNSCIVSRWRNNAWEELGNGYNVTLKFYKHHEHDSVIIETHDSIKMIPVIGSQLTKPNARDIQLKCCQSILDQRQSVYTLRCIDSRTVAIIIDEFQRIKGLKTESISAASSASMIFDKPSNSTSMSSLDEFKPQPPQSISSTMYQQKSRSTLSLGSQDTSFDSTELLLLTQKVRLHQCDDDGDWIPISMGKFSLYSNVSNPQYSKFKVAMNNGEDLDALVSNTTCQRLGRSGLQFIHDDEGSEVQYLLEFKSGKMCEEVCELLY